MTPDEITAQLVGLLGDGIDTNEFGSGRHAYFFKEGTYAHDLLLGYYTTVHGLGEKPDKVIITGSLQCLGVGDELLALNNFWRGAENVAVISATANINNKWAVSQATYLRRFHLGNGGNLYLFDFPRKSDGMGGYASGGFIADSQVDRSVVSGSQQQFLTRNTNLTHWDPHGVWNLVFVGDGQPPMPSWPDSPFTVVPSTPLIREKPYLIFNSTTGSYEVARPVLKTASSGPSNFNASPPTLLIDSFYIAKEDLDTTDTLNMALQSGKNLILTPGVYHLTDSLQVTHDNTVVLGLGMATLIPDNGTPALTVADAGDVSISGLIVDAGPVKSSSLILLGAGTNTADHRANPIVLQDVCCRVGGATPGLAASCLIVNVNDTILDNVWIWRADHGNRGTNEWVTNAAENGLTVNADRVTAYGLFVEHFQGYQTIWNGNDGQVYFYQSEIPYDVPSQDEWRHGDQKGFASYKVSDTVTSHTATGLGIYCFFRDTPGIELDNAIETPTGSGINMSNMVTKWLDGKPRTYINHIWNGMGRQVSNGLATLPE